MNAITLVNVALHALLLSAIGWALVRWCVADARHRAWAAVLALLASMVAPLLMELRSEAPLPAPEETPASATVSSWKPDWRISTASIAPVPLDLPVDDQVPAETAWSIADLARWAGFGWLAIAFVMICRHGFMSFAAWRWSHSLRKPTREELAALPAPASSAPLRVSQDDVCPCVVGLWRSVIAVPQRILTAWDTRQWMWLLRHEGEHVRGSDTLLVWLLGWMKALLWWNPFVHALIEQWSQAREEICDRAAISDEPDPAPYSGFLLDVAAGATSRSPILLHMAASRPARRLRARMTAMLARRRVREKVSRLFLLGAFAFMTSIAAVVSCVGLKAEDLPEIQSQTQTTESNHEQTMKKYSIPKTLLAALMIGTGQAAPDTATLQHSLTVTPTIKRAFQAGDAIEIHKVTGTVPKFQVDGTYRITGVCRQQSLRNASLYVGNTAPRGSDAIAAVAGSSLFKMLPLGVTEFDVTFKVLRPGQLHLTIYDMDSQNKRDSAFAGVYLGKIGGEPGLQYTLSVTPEIKRAFREGDSIEIRKITGTAPKFEVGGTYRVTGVCRQQTLENASLYLGNTAERGAPAIVPVEGSSLSRKLPPGETEFDITFTLRRPGLVHVTIYDLDKHDANGNAYAGIYLGDSVLKR